MKRLTLHRFLRDYMGIEMPMDDLQERFEALQLSLEAEHKLRIMAESCAAQVINERDTAEARIKELRGVLLHVKLDCGNPNDFVNEWKMVECIEQRVTTALKEN